MRKGQRHNPESIEKISTSRRGKCSGEKNPMFGVRRLREDNPSWKGGYYKNGQGYILILKPEHPQADSKGYVYEHRLIAEEVLGRFLQKNEIVHHINRNRADNREKNLLVLTKNHHGLLESKNRQRNADGTFSQGVFQ